MALLSELFPGITGFNWDEGNSAKTWQRHGVTQAEAEQVFLNRPLVVGEAHKQAAKEARPMSRKERRVYAQNQGV